MLEIRLLGQFSIMLNGKLVEIPSRPAQSLLAYLAVTTGVAHRREKLAGLLWPDSPEEVARRNLRKALWHIRKVTEGHPLLRAEEINVTFEAGPEVWVDALVVSQKLTSDREADELYQIVSAYGGELLPGFYDEWIIVERERLQALFEKRIKLLLERLIEAKRWNEVLEWGERWIALASSPEPAYRALMTAYAGLGDLSGVGRTYQRCTETLQRDLGVAPSTETGRLFKELSQKEKDLSLEVESSYPAVREARKEPPTREALLKTHVEARLPASQAEAEETMAAQPPFKGLQFFDEADASLFFGREALTARLLERLGIPWNSNSPAANLLAIVGASGSGKSSLARAGLVPAIRRSQISQEGSRGNHRKDWQIVILTPTARPLEMLASSLTQNVESVSAAATLMDDMTRDPRSLRLFLHKLPTALVLVIDQMEELFTLCRDEDERQAFIDNLLYAAQSELCKVILTLRADFYAHCSRFEALRSALATSQEYIGPMSAAELRRAIEEPARISGYTFEAGLVDLILREAGSEPGALPLLSHALLETWKRRQDHTLTLAGYAEAGGVHGAITRTAESLYQQLDPPQQRITRNIFLRLTELGEGVQDTRRRVALNELIPHLELRASVEEVLNLLAERRLVTVSQESVEVSHEALIREWPALRTWLSEDRDGLRMHRRLTEAAQSWQELDCDPSELYREARLAQALEWSEGHADELNDLERDFLAASQAQVRQEASDREAARQREVEAARRFAEYEQRRAEDQARTAHRFRWLAAGLAILLFVAVALTSLVVQQRDQVAIQARLATSRELAASALGNLKVDPERSVLLSLRALDSADTLEAESALHQAAQANRLIRVIKTKNQWPSRMAVSPDGLKLAVTSLTIDYSNFTTEIWDIASGEKLLTLPGGLAATSWTDSRRIATVVDGPNGQPSIKFWDARSGEELSNLPRDDLPGQATNGDFSPDWTLVAESLRSGTTVVSRLDTGKPLFTLGEEGSSYGIVKFSPDGKRLVTDVNNSLHIWDTGSGQELTVLPFTALGSNAVAFSPKQDQIAVGIGQEVKIVDVSTGQILRTLVGQTGDVWGIRYSLDGSLLATAGSNSVVIIWNAVTGQMLLSLAGHTGALLEITFLPTGNQIASSSVDGTVRISDISPAGNNEGTALYDYFGRPYSSISYSPDGKQLAVSGGSAAGEIFDSVSSQRLVTLSGPLSSYQGSVAFSPDGKLLAITSGENNAYIRDVASGKILLVLKGHTGWIGDLVFSPDGRRLATIGFDGKAIVWDTSTGTPVFTVSAFSEVLETNQVLGIDFSPDGKRIATAGRIPKVWDAATGKELLSLPEQPELVYSVAFSPDGQRLAIGVALGLGASIWDLSTGQRLAQLLGHQGSVQAILFSHDGKEVYTGSVDGSIKIWDSATGEELLTLTRQDYQITGLALSPDGTRLAASSLDGTARVYLLKLENLIQLAKKRLTRGLTPEECKEYLHTEACPEKP